MSQNSTDAEKDLLNNASKQLSQIKTEFEEFTKTVNLIVNVSNAEGAESNSAEKKQNERASTSLTSTIMKSLLTKTVPTSHEKIRDFDARLRLIEEEMSKTQDKSKRAKLETQRVMLQSKYHESALGVLSDLRKLDTQLQSLANFEAKSADTPELADFKVKMIELKDKYNESVALLEEHFVQQTSKMSIEDVRNTVSLEVIDDRFLSDDDDDDEDNEEYVDNENKASSVDRKVDKKKAFEQYNLLCEPAINSSNDIVEHLAKMQDFLFDNKRENKNEKKPLPEYMTPESINKLLASNNNGFRGSFEDSICKRQDDYLDRLSIHKGKRLLNVEDFLLNLSNNENKIPPDQKAAFQEKFSKILTKEAMSNYHDKIAERISHLLEKEQSTTQLLKSIQDKISVLNMHLSEIKDTSSSEYQAISKEILHYNEFQKKIDRHIRSEYGDVAKYNSPSDEINSLGSILIKATLNLKSADERDRFIKKYSQAINPIALKEFGETLKSNTRKTVANQMAAEKKIIKLKAEIVALNDEISNPLEVITKKKNKSIEEVKILNEKLSGLSANETIKQRDRVKAELDSLKGLSSSQPEEVVKKRDSLKFELENLNKQLAKLKADTEKMDEDRNSLNKQIEKMNTQLDTFAKDPASLAKYQGKLLKQKGLMIEDFKTTVAEREKTIAKIEFLTDETQKYLEFAKVPQLLSDAAKQKDLINAPTTVPTGLAQSQVMAGKNEVAKPQVNISAEQSAKSNQRVSDGINSKPQDKLNASVSPTSSLTSSTSSLSSLAKIATNLQANEAQSVASSELLRSQGKAQLPPISATPEVQKDVVSREAAQAQANIQLPAPAQAPVINTDNRAERQTGNWLSPQRTAQPLELFKSATSSPLSLPNQLQKSTRLDSSSTNAWQSKSTKWEGRNSFGERKGENSSSEIDNHAANNKQTSRIESAEIVKKTEVSKSTPEATTQSEPVVPRSGLSR